MFRTCSKHRVLRNTYKVVVRETEQKRPLERVGIDGRIILNGS
jgi:hypothetical protein